MAKLNSGVPNVFVRERQRSPALEYSRVIVLYPEEDGLFKLAFRRYFRWLFARESVDIGEGNLDNANALNQKQGVGIFSPMPKATGLFLTCSSLAPLPRSPRSAAYPRL